MNNPYSTGCTQMCNQGRDCTCVVQQCQSAAPEGGNVWFAEPESTPLSPWEAIAIYGFILFFSLISLACIAMGAGCIYQHFFN